jgi:hypothetical protein
LRGQVGAEFGGWDASGGRNIANPPNWNARLLPLHDGKSSDADRTGQSGATACGGYSAGGNGPEIMAVSGSHTVKCSVATLAEQGNF